MPLAAALRGRSGVATDGLALDTLAQAGDALLHRVDDPARRHPAMRAGAVDSAFSARSCAMRPGALCRAEIDDELKSWPGASSWPRRAGSAGHPAEVVLTFYATRTVRGISLTPHAVLGADVATVTPCTDHGVAAALLATRPAGEVPHQDLPGAVREGERRPWAGSPRPTTSSRRRRSPATGGGSPPRPSGAMSGCSPAGPWSARSAPRSAAISPRARSAEGLADPTLHRGVLAISLFHLWHERYRDRLAGDDPLDELGLTLPGARLAARRAATSSG